MNLSRKQQTHNVPWIDRGWYLATQFEKSSSMNFHKVVMLAHTHPGFIQLMDERNILIYRNIYREHDLRQFQELYALIKNWKGTTLYFKGDEVDYESVESGIHCYIQTKLEPASRGDALLEDGCHTFMLHRLETSGELGCLGCRRSGVSMHWPPGQNSDFPPWFFYGRLDQHKVYRLQKDELHQAVRGHLILYASCPLVNLERTAEFIAQLPDRIDPRKDHEWEYTLKRHQTMTVRYHKIPEVMPKSLDAYRMYLKRVL